MVGVFVRLKLRMLRNRLGSSSVPALIGFVLVWLAAFGLGVGGAVLFAAGARFVPAIRDELPVILFALVAIGWVVGPVVAASIEDSLDPRRFEALPIGRTQLAVGLAAAGLVGPGGVSSTLAVVLGSAAGYAGPTSLAPVVLAAVVQVLLAGVTARWLITLLTDLLRSRRTREVAALIVGLTMALPGLLSLLINVGGVRFGGSIGGLAAGLAWLPNGALGRAVVAFADGDWTLGWGALAYGAVTLVLVAWAYGRAIDRLQVTVGSGVGGRQVRAGRTFRPSRFPLPAGPIGAVAAKELIYLRRDGRVRGQMVGSLIGIVVIAGVALPVLRTEYGPYLTLPMAFFVMVALVVNQFGYDGGSFWGYLTIAPDMIEVLRGKNLAAAIVGVPASAVAAVVGAVLAGSWVYVPAALISAVAVIAVWSAVGNITSILGPIRMPESNPFGSSGISGAAFLVSFLGLFSAGLLMSPVIGMVAVATWLGGPVWAAVASMAAVGFGVVVYVSSFRVTRPTLQRNLHSIMSVIDAE